MCCFTHSTVYPGTEPRDPRLRCRCGVGQPDDEDPWPGSGYEHCERQATQEDMLCDICAGRPHEFDLPSPFTGVTNTGLEESEVGKYIRGEFAKYMQEMSPSPWISEPPKLTSDIPIGEMPQGFVPYTGDVSGIDVQELIRRLNNIPSQ